MSVQIQFRRDTTAAWSSVNPILAQGEVGLDTTRDTSKIGDGVTAWNDLPERVDTFIGAAAPAGIGGPYVLFKSLGNGIAELWIDDGV